MSRSNDSVLNDKSKYLERIPYMSEDELALLIAKDLKEVISAGVEKYVSTVEFNELVESVKQSKRKEILASILDEVNLEKVELLKVARENIRKEVEEEVRLYRDHYVAEYIKSLLENERTAEEILLLNRIKMQNKQQEAFDDRLSADQVRLMEIMKKKEQDSLKLIAEPIPGSGTSAPKSDNITIQPKVCFGLKKSKLF